MIRYQKARIAGQMFRGGYEGEGTDLSGGFGDGPGSGWGGTVSTGKPGEDAMAQAGAKQLGSVSDKDFGNMTGFNPENPTQTVDQMQASSNVNRALSFGLPTAMSIATPGFGLVNTIAKGANNLLSGMNPLEAVGGLVSGVVNGKLNEVTGGLYGKARMASDLSGYLGGPTMPNAGAEVAKSLAGGAKSGFSVAQSAPSAPADPARGDQQMAAQAPAAPPAPAATAAQADDVTLASLGIDSAGWTSATKKYLGAKYG